MDSTYSKKPKLTRNTSNSKRRWFQKLAAFLERRGRHRMIYRDEDRLKTVDPEGPREKYLERFYILSTPWLGVYIHRFWTSDPDGLHDHPWSSYSWILEGGYKERIAGEVGGPLIRMPGDRYFRPAQEAHRIELLDGEEPGSCWTLFIRFRRKRMWGFYRGGDWVPAKVQSRGDK